MPGSLNIGVDGGSLFRKYDGVGRYSANLLKALVAKDPGNHYWVIGFADDRHRKALVEPGGNLSFIYLPYPRRLYQFIYKLIKPLALDRFIKPRLDAMLYFNFVRTPLVKKAPSITVVHDLGYLDVPQYIEKKNLAYLSKFVPRSVADSRVVVAVSDFTKRRVLQAFQSLKPDVRVVPNALDPGFLRDIPASEQARIWQQYGLPQRFVFYLGTIEPRKNIDNIVRACASLQDCPLVLSGAMGWNVSKSTRELISKLESEDKIVLTGHIPDEDLPAVYSLAQAFVWPTLYEGFGLPMLEAMSAGIPQVVSNTEPHISLVGDAGLFVDPQKPGEIADALNKLLRDDELCRQLGQRGKQRAQNYTWSASADQLLHIIQEVTSENRH